jgi:release factor glutamine methyltransferase
MEWSAWLGRRRKQLIAIMWRWRFELLQRRRYDRLVLERSGPFPLVILPEVFNPTLFFTSTYFVACFNAERIPPGGRVLDMGTGSGIGAIAAARWAGSVVAVDINPAAARCARINTLLNRLEARIEVREGDLFAPVGDERFDVVLFNPPFYQGAPQSALDHAWRSTDVVERFVAALPAHLTPHGCALIIWSANSGEARMRDAFARAQLEVRVIAEQDNVGERLIVYQVRPGPGAA